MFLRDKRMIQGKRGDPDKGALYPTQFNCQRLSQPLRGIYHEDKYGLIIIFRLGTRLRRFAENDCQ